MTSTSETRTAPAGTSASQPPAGLVAVVRARHTRTSNCRIAEEIWIVSHRPRRSQSAAPIPGTRSHLSQSRDSHHDKVPGFVEFHLRKGPKQPWSGVVHWQKVNRPMTEWPARRTMWTTSVWRGRESRPAISLDRWLPTDDGNTESRRCLAHACLLEGAGGRCRLPSVAFANAIRQNEHVLMGKVWDA
jgi:hypothetical protein